MEFYKYSHHRNTKYLAWLRSQSCIVSGQKAEVTHHVRLGTNGGKGLKPSDYFCIPLIEEFHTTGQNAVHRIGEESFLSTYSIDKEKMFQGFLKSYVAFTFGDIELAESKSVMKSIELLIEKIESSNITQKKSKQIKKASKELESKVKTSIKDDKFYQKSKELKRIRDKELRDKLKKTTSSSSDKYQIETKKSKKIATSGNKKSITENEFYQKAKELKRVRDKELRSQLKSSSKLSVDSEYNEDIKALQKEKQSEYRKKMYKIAKEEKKKYLAKMSKG